MVNQELSFELYKQKVTTLRDALAIALRLEVWQATHQRNGEMALRTAPVVPIEEDDRVIEAGCCNCRSQLAACREASSEPTVTAADQLELRQLWIANRQLKEENSKLQQQRADSSEPLTSHLSTSTCQPVGSAGREQFEHGGTSRTCKVGKNKRLFCFYCRRRGHVKRDCSDFQAAEWIDTDKLLEDDDYGARVNGIQQKMRLRVALICVCGLTTIGCHVCWILAVI